MTIEDAKGDPMTLRDYFAAKAIAGFRVAGIIALEQSPQPWAVVAEWAYGLADAMVAQREEPSGLALDLAACRTANVDLAKAAKLHAEVSDAQKAEIAALRDAIGELRREAGIMDPEEGGGA